MKVLIARFIRAILALPLIMAQDKWGLYKKQKKAGQCQISIATILAKPLTWYFIMGTFILPLANCIGYYMAPPIFWTILLASFAVIAVALFFLAGIKNIPTVIKASLFYGFCTILLTIFCSAAVDGRSVLVIPGVFLTAFAGTLLVFRYAIGQKGHLWTGTS